MKVTQQVIDIARTKLSNPLGLTLGTIQEVEVSSVETGHSSEDDECIGLEVAKFVLGRKGWECMNTTDTNDAEMYAQVVGVCDKHGTPLNTLGICNKCLAQTEPGIMYDCKPALNVVELKPMTKEPGENVVQRLEQALDLARKGELSNVAIVAVLNDGDVMDCWANGSQPYAIVGGLESLKFEFITNCIESR